jgi:hypothetical protein
MPFDTTHSSSEEAHAELEKCLIDEYLKGKGYTLESLKKLTEDEAHRIMSEASTYVSCKLAEIENKARYKQNIQGTGHHIES